MELPDAVNIEVQNIRGYPVPGIIVEITVKSGTKNLYHILSPKTDENGKTEIARASFEGQFKDHWEEGLMDYNGTIETADSRVKVSLYDPRWIMNNKEAALSWPLFKHEELIWESREQKYDYLVSCKNFQYFARPRTFDISKSPTINFKVRKKWLKI